MDLITKYVLCGSRREDERRRRDEDSPSNGAQQPALQTMVRRIGRRTSRGEEDEQSRLVLPKNLIRPLPGAGSQERAVPETYSPVRRCTPALGMVKTTVAAQQREEAKP